MKNPIFNLTNYQTDELRDLWDGVSHLVDPIKNSRVILKLSRRAAVLTHRQLYLICVNLANFNQAVPDWCHDLLESNVGEPL
jgi:hypothetical protein